MKAKIIDTTEKNTFNGKQLGFVLDKKNESNQEYYPFYQSMVDNSTIGKYLNVIIGNGNRQEFLSNE
ncbi:MAG: hypothetical protein PHX80_05220 [Candidatus Nanoarchaeia archaeon]|nr:hypothetical protein [Candidatus Nanoarchaeia archaeon]